MVAQELDLRERLLLELAANGATGEEMQKRTGIPAAKALQQVRELLQSLDVWDEVERRKLLLMSTYALKERVEKALDEYDPKSVDVYLKLIRTVSDLLEKQGRISGAELDRVSHAQARRLLQLIEAGYQRARDLLAAEYPDVDLDVIDGAFQAGMSDYAE